MQSIKSNAIEPTKYDLRGKPPVRKVLELLPVYGLVVLLVLLIGLFSIILPDTFPTMLNLRSIISILSLAVMIPMVTGKIDLTVGYGIVLWHILAITLQTEMGLPWPVAVVV